MGGTKVSESVNKPQIPCFGLRVRVRTHSLTAKIGLQKHGPVEKSFGKGLAK